MEVFYQLIEFEESTCVTDLCLVISAFLFSRQQFEGLYMETIETG